MSRARPYIPAGCDQQGRLQPARAAACSGWCHLEGEDCNFSPCPAEACTELGADTAPAPLGLVLRLRIAVLRWQVDCLTAEREHYRCLGWVGPIYLRESYAEQRRLMSRISRLQAVPATRHAPAWRRTVGTALAAIVSAAGLVLAACGGGGSDEEPQPRPGVDCKAHPEACK